MAAAHNASTTIAIAAPRSMNNRRRRSANRSSVSRMTGCIAADEVTLEATAAIDVSAVTEQRLVRWGVAVDKARFPEFNSPNIAGRWHRRIIPGRVPSSRRPIAALTFASRLPSPRLYARSHRTDQCLSCARRERRE